MTVKAMCALADVDWIAHFYTRDTNGNACISADAHFRDSVIEMSFSIL